MKRKPLSLALAILFFASATVLPAQKVKSVKDLESRYRKWLQEDVVYIITPKEKQVFLQLETDRERDLFIEAFWKHRDPNPDTPENEFKTEHYRRIAYANQYFGKESPGPGWRTDMGRIYVILGEPKSIDKYENVTEIRPTIVWFYEGLASLGLPDSFNVVFYKKEMGGEFELYSPVEVGPQNLLYNYQGDPTDYLSAYNQLVDIEPAIATISLSLIPGETQTGLTPSMASEVLLNSRIPAAAYERVKDDYAEKLLRYKDIIEVEYSANYIGSDFSVRAIRDRSGTFFVHYLIEPKRLSLGQVQNRFRTNLDINALISDPKGQTVYQYERKVPIDLDQEQLGKIRSKLFSFQDMFPLVEGRYRLNVLWKNTTSKEFTSVEAELIIPDASALDVSPLLLANRLVREADSQGKNKPFRFDDFRLVPSPRNDFSADETLYLFFQAYGLSEDLKENGSLEYSLLKGEETVLRRAKKIKDYPGIDYFLEEFPLAQMPPADYLLKVTILDGEQRPVLARQAHFYITPVPSLPRPWILSLPAPPATDPANLNILGNELLNLKEVQKGRALLEKAYRQNPNSPKFALDFCRVLMEVKDYAQVKSIALPLARDQGQLEFLPILGQASQLLGEYEQAISYYKIYLNSFGTNIPILNSIGECYNRLGNREEALIAWEKSLELNPRQEDIKKKVEALKKNR